MSIILISTILMLPDCMPPLNGAQAALTMIPDMKISPPPRKLEAAANQDWTFIIIKFSFVLVILIITVIITNRLITTIIIITSSGSKISSS